jgi:hypothetical protein
MGSEPMSDEPRRWVRCLRSGMLAMLLALTAAARLRTEELDSERVTE